MSTLKCARDLPAGVLRSVQVGRAAPLGPDGVMSGFVKSPHDGAVMVNARGLDGDEQVDLRVHGGPDKAVYGYASSRYAEWRAQFPRHAALLVAGGLGENLTMEGCDETQVCVLDVVRIGTVILQVTQPRQPCFKFALRFNDIAMPRAMTQIARVNRLIVGRRGTPAERAEFAQLVRRPSTGGTRQ
jgi:MOSC domain-containing protein YiiM